MSVPQEAYYHTEEEALVAQSNREVLADEVEMMIETALMHHTYLTLCYQLGPSFIQ